MAWGIVYQSDFYNVDGKLVTTKLWKDGGSGATQIRTQSVSITLNYQGDNVPVVGTGARMTFVNDSGSFTTYDDLLSATEREYKLTIEWDGNTVFDGFVVCDLNEQQMLDKSIITIQATNYLRRLEDYKSTELSDITGRVGYFELVHDAIDLTNLENNLYVNSTLFEDDMEDDAPSTFITWLYARNVVFYVNQDEWEDVYTCLNKMLLPVGGYLYAYGDKWVIERYGDIDRTGDWVYYTFDSYIIANATSSLKQELNKQDGDFKYVEMSQVIQYNTGFQKLQLNLQDQPVETLVFNNFTDTNTVADGDPSILASYDTWYINENVLESSTGVWYGSISKYIYWKPNDQDRGIYYRFNVQFNETSPTELSVSYKAKHQNVITTNVSTYLGRFFLRICGGDFNTYYIAEDETTGDVYLTTDRYVFECNATGTKNTDVFDVSRVVDLSDCGTGSNAGDIESIIIGILPPSYSTLAYPDSYGYPIYNWMGDVVVKIEPEAIDNQIDYELSEDFIKTEEIDLDLFDLDNLNYSNGLEVGILSGTKTDNWYTDGVTDVQPLVDIFAKDRYRKLYKTRRSITAKIKADKWIKPFAILTDDNISDESADDPAKFIITSYTWDLVNGTYDIVAEEYPDEVITVDGS